MKINENYYLELIANKFAEKQFFEEIEKGNIKPLQRKSPKDIAEKTTNGGRYVSSINHIEGIDSDEKHLLKELASRFDFTVLDKYGYFKGEIKYLTQEQLAKELSMSIDKLQRVIKNLEIKGFIEVISNADKKNKRRGVNSYKILDKTIIEANKGIQALEDAKYERHLQAAKDLKESFKKQFLSNPVTQALFGLEAEVELKDVPQSAVSDTANQPHSPLDLRYIVPYVFSLNNSPFVCFDPNETNLEAVKLQSNTHMIEKDTGEKKPAIADSNSPHAKKITKNALIKSDATRISTKHTWPLSDSIKRIYGLSHKVFICNEDCKQIIENVVAASKCTIQQFLAAVKEVECLDRDFLFDFILSKSRFDKQNYVNQLSNDFIKYISSKDNLIEKYKAQKLAKEDENRKAELETHDRLKKQEEEEKLKAEKRLEIEKIKEKQNSERFNRLPDIIRNWIVNLEDIKLKNRIKKDFLKMPDEQFIAFVNGIIQRNRIQNFYN